MLKDKNVLLLLLFLCYAVTVGLIDLFSAAPNLAVSIPFIAGAGALVLAMLSVFVFRKIFPVVLFFFLAGSAFYFEFHPYTVYSSAAGFNGHTVFYGRPIPFLFLIAYLVLNRKPILHFIRTTSLWN